MQGKKKKKQKKRKRKNEKKKKTLTNEIKKVGEPPEQPNKRPRRGMCWRVHFIHDVI